MLKKATFFDLMSLLRRGSLQLCDFQDLGSKAVISYSFYQNIGIITGYRYPIDSLASAGPLFLFASFVSFDLNLQTESLTTLFLVFNALFLIYMSTQIILLGFQAAELKSAASESSSDPCCLFKPGFLDTMIQIYIWVFFMPMWELALAPIVCRSLPAKARLFPQSPLENSYSYMAHERAGILGLSIVSLLCQFVWVGLLLKRLLPRSPIPENYLVSESRALDMTILAHKFQMAFRSLLIYVLPTEGRIAMSLVRVCLLLSQIVIALNQLTFTRVSTARFFVRGAFFNIGFELVQFITVFGKWGGLPLSMISFEQSAIITGAFLMASWGLERHFFWRKLRPVVEVPTGRLTSADLFRYFTLYRFAKENSFRRFVYNGNDTLHDVSRFHNLVLSHFARCDGRSKCVCGRLRAGESFWDKQASSAIFLRQNDASGLENLKTVCSLGFAKLLLQSTFEAALQEERLDSHLLFQYLRYLLFEEADYFNASLLLNHVRQNGISASNSTDLLYLEVAFRREVRFHSDHKVVRANYPNSEKFLAILETSEAVQDLMIDSAECLVAVLHAISDQKSVDRLRFQLIWDSLAAFEATMKSIRREFACLPRNMRLFKVCREFVRSFCQDFHGDHLFKKMILEPIHRFNRDQR